MSMTRRVNSWVQTLLFSFRELAGWLLIAAGLFCFLISIGMYQQAKYVSAGGPLIIGMVVFRGGIHLVKVATAARVVLLARRRDDSA